jgi:hypothetical protein
MDEKAKSNNGGVITVLVILIVGLTTVIFLQNGSNINDTDNAGASTVQDKEINQSKQSQNIMKKDCTHDSIIVEKDTVLTDFDYANDSRTLPTTVDISYEDENDVAFTDKANMQVRIVYQYDKKNLLVYFNRNVQKKYVKAVAINENQRTFKCLEGKYVEFKGSPKTCIYSGNQKVLEININQTITGDKDTYVRYISSANKSYGFHAGSFLDKVEFIP